MLAPMPSEYPLADTKLPFRRLLVGSRPSSERILIHSMWFKGHNNPRYAELLPRLRRLDAFLVVCSEHRIPRALQYRALRASRHVRHKLFYTLANRSYRYMLTADNEQIPYFSGAVVSDTDDPKFTDAEVRQLNSPQLAAYVVTADWAGKRLEELGVDKPYHAIPQGVSLRSLSSERTADIRARFREDGEVVVGYMAGSLLSAEDRHGANPLFNIDHLLDLWDEIAARVPDARLWLLGEASESIVNRCRGRTDIRLLGRVPKDDVLSYTANFDLALYPRTADQGVQAAKVAEYLGAGVPTISYDYRVTEILRETGGGVLVESPAEFIEATASLATDTTARAQLAEAARRAGAALDWDVLAERYEVEVLDRYLKA